MDAGRYGHGGRASMSEQRPSILSQLMAGVFIKPPLQIFSVLDRGLPNSERVNLRVNARTYLGDYFLHAGVFLPNGRAFPLPNMSLWLGEDTIEGGSWVIIYTGPGEPKLMTQTKDTHELVIVLHWHLTQTIFADKSVVPVLVKLDKTAIQIGQPGSP